MMKVLFFAVLTLCMMTNIGGQDIMLRLEKDNKVKVLVQKSRTTFDIATNGIDTELGDLKKVYKVKICGKNQEELQVCVLEENVCIVKGSECVKYSETKYESEKIPTRIIKFDEIISIRKSSFGPLKVLHAFSTLVSTVFVAILNPLIHFDYDENVVKGDLWLKAHVISVGALIEGIAYLSVAKYPQYEISNEIVGWKLVR